MAQALDFKATGPAGEVLVSGSLNRNTVPEAWASRGTWLPRSDKVSLDLAAVEQVDSAGLAMLIQLQSELASADRKLSLRNMNTQLQQFAAVSGVTGLLSLS